MRAMSVVAAGALAFLAACGGASEKAAPASTSAATTAAKTASTAATTSAAGSSGAAATATKAAATAAAAKAGATAADACAVITVDEVARVMGASGVKAEGQPELAGATYCTYRDGSGKAIVATSYLKAGADVFNAVASSMQPQTGVGDKSQWDPNTATLHVLKGQTVLTISAGDGSVATAQRLDLAKQLGQLGAARQ